MTSTNPFVAPTPDDPAAEPSIVDTILDLDKLLSSDVRRAEKTARFCTEPWREARIDELQIELEGLTDDQGNPLDDAEASVAAGRTARTVALELREEQRAYAATFRSVRMRQLPADDWRAFQAKWKSDLEAGGPFPDAMWDELIAASAFLPKITEAQVAQMRAKLGHPQVDELGATAWNVNATAGVSVPKSQLSSVVLRRTRPGKS